MTQAAKAQVDEVLYVPAALALHQRPGIPSIRCPNGHYVPSTLVPDESLSINDGAMVPWQTLMWSLMKDIAREMGVRTDVPFRELTPEERDTVENALPSERRTGSLRWVRRPGSTADGWWPRARFWTSHKIKTCKSAPSWPKRQTFMFGTGPSPSSCLTWGPFTCPRGPSTQ